MLDLFIAGNDWVVWTPEGYYAATPGGEKLTGWVVNHGLDQLASFYPTERFRARLFRPNVVKLVLDKDCVAAALKTADADLGHVTRSAKLENLMPPRVVLTKTDQNKAVATLKVRATAANADQPVKALRLLLDGRPLPGNDSSVDLGMGQAEFERDFTIAVPEGKHTVTALAQP